MNGDLERRVSRARSRLGVGPRAGAETLRRAFRSRSLEAHPDRGGQQAEFEELHAAYELLRDADDDADERWLVGDEADSKNGRVMYDSEPRRRRRSFQQLFAEALGRSERPSGPNGS